MSLHQDYNLVTFLKYVENRVTRTIAVAFTCDMKGIMVAVSALFCGIFQFSEEVRSFVNGWD